MNGSVFLGGFAGGVIAAIIVYRAISADHARKNIAAWSRQDKQIFIQFIAAGAIAGAFLGMLIAQMFGLDR